MDEAKFLDSSVFLHAFLKPKRGLRPEERVVKEASKKILKGVEKGESVVTTVVHLSEIANIIESRSGLSTSIGMLAWLFSLENLEILDVYSWDYEKALSISQEYSVSINDALAYIKMKEKGVKIIYSFDKHFRNFKDIVVLPTFKGSR